MPELFIGYVASEAECPPVGAPAFRGPAASSGATAPGCYRFRVIALPLFISAALVASAPSSDQAATEAEDTGPLSAHQSPTAERDAPELKEPIWGVALAHGAGVLVGMRASLYALWPNSYPLWQTAETSHILERPYSLVPLYDPHRRLLESDGSSLLLNTVGHGGFGSEVYQRARVCRVAPLHAFVFTALTSAVWEYGFELPYQRPSAVDLIWTPLAGAAFGELRFQLWRLGRGDPSGRPSAAGRALMLLVDPFGELERALGTHC